MVYFDMGLGRSLVIITSIIGTVFFGLSLIATSEQPVMSSLLITESVMMFGAVFGVWCLSLILYHKERMRVIQ